MTALTDFNAVVSGVLAGLNTTFPLPVTLEAQAVAEGFNVTLLEAELALRWLMSSGYVKTLLGHTELDPSHLAGVVLTRKGLLVVSGLPASLIPANVAPPPALPAPGRMFVGQLLGIPWTPDNAVGTATQDPDGQSIDLSISQSSNAFHGYYVPVPNLPCRIIVGATSDPGTNYQEIGIGFKYNSGAVRVYGLASWAPGSIDYWNGTSVASWSDSTVRAGGVPGSLSQILAFDLAVDGSITTSAWVDQTWEQIDVHTPVGGPGVFPVDTGIYLKGQYHGGPTTGSCQFFVKDNLGETNYTLPTISSPA